MMIEYTLFTFVSIAFYKVACEDIIQKTRGIFIFQNTLLLRRLYGEFTTLI
jgi:hypothetical protein